MIPTFDEIRIPVLHILKSGEIMRVHEFEKPLSEHFKLSEDEINQEYASGNGRILLNRVRWVLSDLFISGLAERPVRGCYKITDEGKKILSSCTDAQINDFVNNSVQKKSSKKNSGSKTSAAQTQSNSADSHTPQEWLDNSYDNIKNTLYSDILRTILSKKPYEFERLVVKLLQSLGYGGEVKNSGTVTKISNDGGIDGIIKEDILGFNHISIQAKRYATGHNVSRVEVQNFGGAVAATPSKKGVFITTSDFTAGAAEYVKSLNGNPTIILINGQQLAEYIYDSGLGLQTERILRVMKMDMDFWDAMDNDKQ